MALALFFQGYRAIGVDGEDNDTACSPAPWTTTGCFCRESRNGTRQVNGNIQIQGTEVCTGIGAQGASCFKLSIDCIFFPASCRDDRSLSQETGKHRSQIQLCHLR